MNRREVKALARNRAGLILESVMNDWTPDDLIERYGQDIVDRVQDEITDMAHRMAGDS